MAYSPSPMAPRMLARRWPGYFLVMMGRPSISDSPEFNQLFGELLHLREHKEEVELRESQIKQQLQATLGAATAGLFADGKITWKRSKDRLAPDLERLGQDHPDLLSHYVKPVPGSRRLPFNP